MLELLAPAGNLDAVIAAVQNGADAVYMGFGDGFNARRSADNFTRESFAKAVRYCHIRGCKVYVTLNTLVGDREMEAAAALAQQASDAGADADPRAGSGACARAARCSAGYPAAREHADEHPQPRRS